MSGSISKVAFPKIGGMSAFNPDPISNKVQDTLWKKAGGDQNPMKGILAGGLSPTILSDKLKDTLG